MLMIASCFGVANAQLMVDDKECAGVNIDTSEKVKSDTGYEKFNFFAEDTEWYGMEDYTYWSSHHITSISYSLGADTIIDGISCKALYKGGIYQGAFCEKGEQIWFYPGEELIMKEYLIESMEPFLLYDFSLQTGDTIYSSYQSAGFTKEESEDYYDFLVVKSVREVYGRKIVDFGGEQWIAGIGSTSQPFFERWRLQVSAPGNTYESLYQVVADGATIYFNGELANPNIQPWLKDGMTWIENKQYTEDSEPMSRKISISQGTIPGRFKVKIDNTRYNSPFNELQIINNKAYGLGMDDIFLCYDFSLSKGNKVSLLDYYCYGLDYSTYNYDNCYVASVDTVVYNGVARKRITLSGDRDDVWIEGIGSLIRLFPIDEVDSEGESYIALFSEVAECSYNGESPIYRKDPYLISDGLQWAKCYYYYTGDYTTVAYELRGDTIIDGKSYKKEWSTHWEDLSHMELTGYFMREDAGKVYRKEEHSDEYLWFDYEANIGDTFFYDYSFVKVVGHSDTTIVCNGVSRTYRGVDVQVGYVYDSGTDYEYHLIPGYIETFYEDLGLFTSGDIVSDPSFLTTGALSSLLYVKQGDTMLYQQEEGVLWKDNTRIKGVNADNPEDTPYYDLQGRKVTNPVRGIYIKDGRKVVIDD